MCYPCPGAAVTYVYVLYNQQQKSNQKNAAPAAALFPVQRDPA